MQSKLLPFRSDCAIFWTCLQVPPLRAISLKSLDAVQWLLPCSVRALRAFLFALGAPGEFFSAHPAAAVMASRSQRAAKPPVIACWYPLSFPAEHEHATRLSGRSVTLCDTPAVF
jgi:hypothetical protein